MQVAGLSDVVDLSTRFGHTLALKSDGAVWAWGGNFNGQLGDVQLDVTLSAMDIVGSMNEVDVHWLNDTDETSLSELVQSKSMQWASQVLYESIVITLKVSEEDPGTTLSGVEWVESSNGTARTLRLVGIPDVFSLIELKAPGMITTMWQIEDAPTGKVLVIGIFDGSESIDENDYEAWLNAYIDYRTYGGNYEGYAMYDLSRDGVLNNIDFSMRLSARNHI